MPLNPADITTLANQIISNFELIDNPNIESIIKGVIEITDLKMEEKFPSAYVGTLTGTTLKQKEFLKAREYSILCSLFTEHPEYLSDYNQTATEVENSAGTRVRLQDNKSKAMLASDYCKLARDILVSLDLLKDSSQIAFKHKSNVLSK